MRKNITNLIMLITTSMLLFIVCYAWYATNKVATATGGVGATSLSGGIYDIHVNRYQSTKEFGTNNCTWSESSPLATLEDCKYDDLNPNYKRIVYVIDFKVNSDLDTVTLSIRNQSETRNKDLTEKTDSTTNTQYNNYLSNVCNFYMVDGTGAYTMQAKDEVDTNLLGYNQETREYAIPYSSTNDSNIYTITDVAELTDLVPETVYKFYIAFDYCMDKMNQLYSDNLGTSLDTIIYLEDIEFLLR